MIHHISIPAENPHHVANVLAELWDGYVVPFICPGSYLVLSGDEYGTAIEVYPLGTELIPGNIEDNQLGTKLIHSHDNEQVKFSQKQRTPTSSNFIAVHAAISVPVSQDKIEQIGTREGWRVLPCNRGSFEVIEFWIENKLMLELLPPAMASQYLAALQPQNLKQAIAHARSTTTAS